MDTANRVSGADGSATTSPKSSARGPSAREVCESDVSPLAEHVSLRTQLKMETDGCRHSTRRDVMSSAKSRQEIVQGVFVSEIHHRESCAPFIFIPVENVVMAHSDIEKITCPDARRIVVGIIGAGRRNLDQSRAVLRCWAETRGADRGSDGRVDVAAEESSLELLIRAQPGDINNGIRAVGTVVAVASGARHRPGNQAAIVAPIEAEPWTSLRGLILHVSGGLENLVMIDSKH